MTHTVRPHRTARRTAHRTARRTTAALAALSLGVLALTACNGDAEEEKAAPSATASPSATGTDKDSAPPSTARPGDGDKAGGGAPGGKASTPPPSQPGADDDQDGGVGMCETTDMSYKVTVASKEAGHALLTASNKSGDPCLLAANDLVLTFPGLDGAAEHRGPDGTDWLLEPGGTAYAGILFAREGTEGGKSADTVEIALAASESPGTVPIVDGPVTVNDSQITSFFGTAEDALSH